MNFLDLSKNNAINAEFRYLGEVNFVAPHSIELENRTVIIVGANNSRKSRFLRHLMAEQKFLFCPDKHYDILDRFAAMINKVPNFSGQNFLTIRNLKASQGVKPFEKKPNEFKEIINYILQNNSSELIIKREKFQFIFDRLKLLSESPEEQVLKLIKKEIDLLHAAFQMIFKVPELIEKRSTISQFFNVDIRNRRISKVSFIEDYVRELYDFVNELKTLEYKVETPNISYIPTLRGTIQLLEKNINEDKTDFKLVEPVLFSDTIKKYHSLSDHINVFTGQDLYKRIKSIRNSKRTKREKFERFESFVSKYFFDNKIVDIIALEDEPGQIQIYIEDDSDRKIHQLGDGIQSLLVLLFPIFNSDNGDWIFIEEPEINMHPGLQSLFLNTITTSPEILTKNLRIFISSHSNHLLNCIIDQETKASIFSFEQILGKKERFSVIRKVSDSKTKTLELIGVKNSSTFMSNCSLWVEGISDRYIIKAFLNAYCNYLGKEEYIEGYHYSFFEYAGSNLVHYLFDEDASTGSTDEIRAHLISNKIFLLADTDKGKKTKHDALEVLSRDNFKYSQTGAVEIENVISVKILLKMFKSFWNLDSAKFKIKESDYRNVRMGEFFNKRINPKLTKKKKFSLKSGTLKNYYKNRISSFVLDKVKNKEIVWDDININADAKRIIEDIYNFIDTHN